MVLQIFNLKFTIWKLNIPYEKLEFTVQNFHTHLHGNNNYPNLHERQHKAKHQYTKRWKKKINARCLMRKYLLVWKNI